MFSSKSGLYSAGVVKLSQFEGSLTLKLTIFDSCSIFLLSCVSVVIDFVSPLKSNKTLVTYNTQRIATLVLSIYKVTFVDEDFNLCKKLYKNTSWCNAEWQENRGD